MKQTPFIARPIDVDTFLDAALDENESTDSTNDWREKARQLRQRRWRRINGHGQAVSGAIFSSKAYRHVRDTLRQDKLARNY